jgi:alpha-D-ribose 1-methylphosphonate 5-triphosphate synthase subunit PhnH
MARPGDVKHVAGVHAPSPLMPASAVVLRSLADYETPVWLDRVCAGNPAIAEWIRFQTSAPIIPDASAASLAVVADADALPAFEAFAQGTDEYPDRSTTLIVQIGGFHSRTFKLSGPGIRTERHVMIDGLPDDFVERWAENRALFPRGVDLILVAGAEIMALPRAVQISRAE